MRWGGYSAATERLVTGILVTGTPARPVIYVTSSDPRFGPGISKRNDPVDTNSGVLSRLERTRDGWRRLDLVRGLPRSDADHAPNGLAQSPDGTTLYVAQGSQTNEGAPAERFGNVPEYELSGAILSIDLTRIGERTYDLPTRDDPSRSGVDDENDPFGGNGGLNQARLVPGGPVQVYASGMRNPYDVAVTKAGRLYSVQNGPNLTYGGRPVGEGPGTRCTNEPREGGTRGVDTLHLIRRDGYYGHPNPTRRECDYVPPAVRDAMAQFRMSTNGIAEHEGALVTVSLSGELFRLELSEDGGRVVRRQVLARLASPLDVTVQGTLDAFPGTIWAAQYAESGPGSPVAVVEPVSARDRGWRELPPTGLPRQEVSFVQAGGKLYLAGGGTRHQVYDPRRRRGGRRAAARAARPHPGRRARLGDLLRRRPPGLARARTSSSVYVYDPRATASPEGRRCRAGVAPAASSRTTGRSTTRAACSDGEAVPWLDVYDPAADSLGAAAGHASSTRPLPGGRRGRHALRDRRPAVEPLGTELGETRRVRPRGRAPGGAGLAPLPTARGGFAAAALGGRDPTSSAARRRAARSSTVEAYDPPTDTWRTADPMPTARHGIQAAVSQRHRLRRGGRRDGGRQRSGRRLRGLCFGAHAGRPLRGIYPRRRGDPAGDITPVRPRWAALRVAAERSHHRVHGRPAGGRRVPCHRDGDDRRDPVHPESRRRRVVGHRLRLGDARDPPEGSTDEHAAAAARNVGVRPRRALRRRRAHVRVPFAHRSRSPTRRSGRARSRHGTSVLPLGVESTAGRWAQARPFPIAQDELRAETVDDVVYVGGGLRQVGSDLVSTDVFYAFDPVLGARTQAARRCRAASTTPASSRQAAISTSSAAPRLGADRRGVQVLDHAPAMGEAAVAGCPARLAGGGGDRPAHLRRRRRRRQRGGDARVHRRRGDLRPRTRRWSRGPDMPTARHHAGAAAIGDDVYVLGGRADVDLSLDVVERFDTRTSRWEEAPHLPQGVGALAVVSRWRTNGGDLRRRRRRGLGDARAHGRSSRRQGAGSGSPTSGKRATATPRPRSETRSTSSAARRARTMGSRTRSSS